jgi:hypothetical protein
MPPPHPGDCKDDSAVHGEHSHAGTAACRGNFPESQGNHACEDFLITRDANQSGIIRLTFTA